MGPASSADPPRASSARHRGCPRGPTRLIHLPGQPEGLSALATRDQASRADDAAIRRCRRTLLAGGALGNALALRAGADVRPKDGPAHHGVAANNCGAQRITSCFTGRSPRAQHLPHSDHPAPGVILGAEPETIPRIGRTAVPGDGVQHSGDRSRCVLCVHGSVNVISVCLAARVVCRSDRVAIAQRLSSRNSWPGHQCLVAIIRKLPRSGVSMSGDRCF